MTGVEYSLAEHRFDLQRDLPGGYQYAVIADDHLVLRRRSNGQTFGMAYREELWARKGLARAQQHFPNAVIYRRATVLP